MIAVPRAHRRPRWLWPLALVASGMWTCFPRTAVAQEPVSFPAEDGGLIHGDLYGKGDHAVLLAHGGRFNKESWTEQAGALSAAGFRVLAIDFRGYGRSTGPGDADPLSAPLRLDILAGVRYLRQAGATTVSVVGGSMGGTAAANASIAASPGEIDAVVMLAGTTSDDARQLKGRKLFIIASGDTTGSGALRITGFRDQYEKAPNPKRLIVLDGAAHAQYLFRTDQGPRLLQGIIRFLATDTGID
ncbi:MAG: alpha/beta fold hydrolase [Gemmatimonadota bacterium]